MPQKLCLFQIIILTLRYNSKVKPRLSGTQYHQRFYLQHIKISIVARIEASGTLVYPTMDEDFDFSYRYKETGHRIFVRTVNLGKPWRKIEERVKEIVKGEGWDEWR